VQTVNTWHTTAPATTSTAVNNTTAATTNNTTATAVTTKPPQPLQLPPTTATVTASTISHLNKLQLCCNFSKAATSVASTDCDIGRFITRRSIGKRIVLRPWRTIGLFSWHAAVFTSAFPFAFAFAFPFAFPFAIPFASTPRSVSLSRPTPMLVV
jgi:hypothetical protein